MSLPPQKAGVALFFFIAVMGSFAPCWASQPPSGHGDRVWLAVSDVHLDPWDTSAHPSAYGVDTNVVLLRSVVARMKRAAPNAAVIVLSGDFLAHNFARRVARDSKSRDAVAIRTMRWLARSFERSFPRAQFAIALGNNDVPCGDYRSANESAYLAALARVWAPLVNRNGASRHFTDSFSHGGYYTAALPVHGMRLVVLNTVPLSNRYKGDCRGDDLHAASQELAWLRMTLSDTPPKMRNLVVMHIPPGFDAFSTTYTLGLFPWPFLKGRYDADLVDELEAPRNRVAYALAGHTHRFDFRLAGGIPIVVLGSLSPIYGNDTTFYALRVSANGSLRDIDTYSFDQRMQAWLPPHSFDRTWGFAQIDAASLRDLHARLRSVPPARVSWQYQAEGWPSDLVEDPGAWGGSRWRVSWCAQTFLVAGFAQCAKIPDRLEILSAILVLAGAVAIAVLVIVRRRP